MHICEREGASEERNPKFFKFFSLPGCFSLPRVAEVANSIVLSSRGGRHLVTVNYLVNREEFAIKKNNSFKKARLMSIYLRHLRDESPGLKLDEFSRRSDTFATIQQLAY